MSSTTLQLWLVPSEPESATAVRQRLRTLLEPELPPWADDAVLVASEVVANAVTHGEGPVRVHAYRSAGMLRVEVSDVGAALPERREAPTDAETGRGLLIVDALSAHWGVVEADPKPGKTVWFEMGTSTTSVAGLSSTG
ncbi:ATP-binding protein [Knoellia sp. CPCC 206435]|uniref:ATP-binding protein n=1 Tax=Knoellia terrae TaxID=3404797 RepID=UPI003B42B23F